MSEYYRYQINASSACFSEACNAELQALPMTVEAEEAVKVIKKHHPELSVSITLWGSDVPQILIYSEDDE